MELTSTASECLRKAYENPGAYLAPTLFLPKLQYAKTTAIGPSVTSIPTELTMTESESKSVVEASKLVFSVSHRPWQGTGSEKEWQRLFEDPTTWCVASGKDAKHCLAHLTAYRKALACSAESVPVSCWDAVRDYLELHYAPVVDKDLGKGFAARVEAEWKRRVLGKEFGCKELPLPMAVSKISYDAATDTMTMMLCRSNFRAKSSASDNFNVVWLGENPSYGPPKQTEEDFARSMNQMLFALDQSSTATPAFQNVTLVAERGQFENKRSVNGIRFSATNPQAPSANEFYLETFFLSSCAAHAPVPDLAAFSESTFIAPSLSTKQLYGFRLEASYLRFGDIVPLRDARRWSIHFQPQVSAFFNSGELASSPNSIKVRLPLEFRRTYADGGCTFEYDGTRAKPKPPCATPTPLRRFTIDAPLVIESTQTGTTKNLLFEPAAKIQSRPVDIAGARMSLTLGASYGAGKRLTEAKFPDPANFAASGPQVEARAGIQRLSSSIVFAAKPASPPFEKFTFSIEHKFSQLFRDELHLSPTGALVVVGEPGACGVASASKCILTPKDSTVRNMAKGSRQWFNAQLAFDVSPSLSVVMNYRQGRIAPLYVYTNQFAIGIAFHLDPKAKAKLPTI